MSRIVARENLFKIVFEFLFNEESNPETVNTLLYEDNMTDEDREFVKANLSDITTHYSELIKIIESHLVNYKLERIYKIDLAILLISVNELKFKKEIDAKIVINEAVELAKKYSTDNSYKFINGILAKINEM